MVEKRNAKGEKLYPFSIEKNAHNWELVKNYSRNKICDMESGEIPMDEKQYAKYESWDEQATSLLANWSFFGPIAWMPGKEYGKARDISNIGVEIRMGCLIKAGREDLLQYC